MATRSARKARRQARGRRLKRQRRQARQAMLERAAKSGLIEEGDIIIEDAPVGRKLSEVILEFAEPLTHEAQSEEDFRTILDMAIVAWNAGLLPRKEAEAVIREATADSARAEPEAGPILAALLMPLVQRRRELYGDDRRFILDYAFTGHGADAHLQVVYSLHVKPGEEGMYLPTEGRGRGGGQRGKVSPGPGALRRGPGGAAAADRDQPWQRG